MVAGVEYLEIRLRLGGKSIVFQAQRVEQRIGLITAAALHFGAVGVEVRLLKLAHVEIALDGPVVAD